MSARIDRRTVTMGLVLCSSLVGRIGHAQEAWPSESTNLIPRIDRGPVLNGTLTHEAWRRALRIDRFVSTQNGIDLEPRDQAELSLMHDGRSLFVGFRCFHDPTQRLLADATSAMNVWNDDWVAVAIDPRDFGFSSYFFLQNARGVTAEGALDANGRPRQVQLLSWRHATSISVDGFCAEFALPLAQLPFRTGAETFVGLRAIRFSSGIEQEANLPQANLGLPETPRYRQFLLAEYRGQSRSPRYARDLRAEFQEKRFRIERTDTSTLEGRIAAFGDASVLDYSIFPVAPLSPSDTPLIYGREPQVREIARRFAGLEYAPGQRVEDIDRMQRETQATSLVVIKNDRIAFEAYYNGFNRHSVFTSFSVAKSVVSTLAGIAIEAGIFGSERDSITAYIPELGERDPRFRDISLADLMHMASGLAYEEDHGAHDDRRTYMDPDLRHAALTHTRIVSAPNTEWLYNNYTPLLMGVALERASQQSITQFTQERLWGPLGMAWPSSWSLDSQARRFEKMESGLNAHPLDLAKLGTLHLHHGEIDGRRILSERWVRLATQPIGDASLRVGDGYYGLYWWIQQRADGPSDFYALGNKGQCIYCSPQKNLVIVRTGIQHGLRPQGWPNLFRSLADTY